MTLAYHPFKTKTDLVKNILRVIGLLLIFRWRRAHTLVSDVAGVAAMNTEDKASSLRGLYFLFLGFILQTVGAALAVADVVLGIRLHPS